MDLEILTFASRASNTFNILENRRRGAISLNQPRGRLGTEPRRVH